MMFSASEYWITIGEVKGFIRAASEIFTVNELEALVDYIAVNPDAGDIIPGTGGIRKLRWPARSQGKRSGARVIYYFRDLNMPVYLLGLYTKGEKVDLSEKEKRLMRALVGEIVEAYAVKWTTVHVRPDGVA